MDKACFLTLRLSTEDVETVVEIPAYSIWSFVGNVAGNLGMLFGTSIYSIPFSAIRTYDRYSQTVKVILIASCYYGFLKFGSLGHEEGSITGSSSVSSISMDSDKLFQVQSKQDQV